MGHFVYDRDATVEMDDRTLAHLQVVIINKLRRQESFALTLRDDQRTLSVWVCPQTAMQFVYSGNRRPALNREWIEELAVTANSMGGLRLLPEPHAVPHHELAPPVVEEAVAT
jgi:hypothetical protein